MGLGRSPNWTDRWISDQTLFHAETQWKQRHGKQLLTYLRLLKQPVGLLLNFSQATMKDGIRRVVNDYKPQ